MTQTAEKLTLTAWRDHDTEACALPGMALGRVDLPEPSAAACDDLWRAGVRRVELAEPVDLTATDHTTQHRAIELLRLVRELTARAVHIDWELRLPEQHGDADDWKLLSHLHPPHTITGPTHADDALYAWRTNHYLCKFVWRQGPGFIQIRDRRWGELRRFTADEPEYHQAIADLDQGTDHRRIPPPVLDEFTRELLVLRLGDLAWWLPYRVTRWLQEAMAI